MKIMDKKEQLFYNKLEALRRNAVKKNNKFYSCCGMVTDTLLAFVRIYGER